jgi:dipeptidyl aminopeptidase/acylaminoacyl peptidase
MDISWGVTALGLLLLSTGTAAAALPPLIPRTVLFGNPDRAKPSLACDGRHLAYLAPDRKGVLQVWVRTLGADDDHIVTADSHRGIHRYFWSYDPDCLLYLQDSDGDENDHLYAVNIKTKQVRDLTPFEGVRTEGVELEPAFPHEALVGLNLKNRESFDIYRINLDSGASKLDTENPGNMVEWIADARFQVRAGRAMTPDGGSDLLVRDTPLTLPSPPTEGGEGKGEAHPTLSPTLGGEGRVRGWRKVRHWTVEDEGGPVLFSQDGQTLYLAGNHDSDTIRLLRLDLATDKETVVAADPEHDLGEVLRHPVRRTIQAASFNRDQVTWQVLDPDLADDFKALGKLRPGQCSVISRDLEDKTWLVEYVTDDGPVYYYTYDRASRQGKLLFSHRPALEKLTLAPMKPISYKARDGLTIHGYLTVPVGVPAKKLPAVLLVHGGPWDRDTWGYNREVQWLANRGYAVLQVNFRGSTGYGKKFLNAGNREWAGKMHDDLLDGVDWLVKQGVADRKKVAIMGTSYGGYAALVGLSFTPDVFAAGVSLVGPSNLVSLLKSIPPYWAPEQAMFCRRVGDPEKDEVCLKGCSPLFCADRIKAPLLLGQGANDPRVKQSESDQIFAALCKGNKCVQYAVYTDEGHGFERPENRLHFHALAEAFLARHLGGRAEPLGEIKGHSAVVKGQ